MNNGSRSRRKRGSPIVQNPDEVRLAREEAGLQQQELAALLHISPELMCEIESGRRNAGRIRLRKIAEITNHPYRRLLNAEVATTDAAESA